jgi:hypothetical protein
MGHLEVGADVGFGWPIQVGEAGVGKQLHDVTQELHWKDFAGKEQGAQFRIADLSHPAMQQHANQRRRH